MEEQMVQGAAGAELSCETRDIDRRDLKVGEERRGMALDFPQMCGGPT